jgi:hypothetical protein
MAKPLTAQDVRDGRVIYLEILGRFTSTIRFAGPYLPTEVDAIADGHRKAGCFVDSIAAPTGYQQRLTDQN